MDELNLMAAHKDESRMGVRLIAKTLSKYATDFSHKNMQILHNVATNLIILNAAMRRKPQCQTKTSLKTT